MENSIENRFRNVAKSKTFRNIIRRFSLDKKAVLDIGCTYGEYLKHFGRGSIGLTIIEKEIEIARSLDLDVRLGNIEDEIFFVRREIRCNLC